MGETTLNYDDTSCLFSLFAPFGFSSFFSFFSFLVSYDTEVSIHVQTFVYEIEEEVVGPSHGAHPTNYSMFPGVEFIHDDSTTAIRQFGVGSVGGVHYCSAPLVCFSVHV